MNSGKSSTKTLSSKPLEALNTISIIVDRYGQPLSTSSKQKYHLTPNNNDYCEQFLVEVADRPDDVTHIPFGIDYNENQMYRLMSVAPQTYWNSWFSDKHRNNDQYLLKAMDANFSEDNFNSLPIDLKTNNKVFLKYLQKDYKSCVLTYQQMNLDGLPFALRFISLNPKDYLKYVLRNRLTTSHKILFTWGLMKDILDHREEWNSLASFHKHKMNLNILFNHLDLVHLKEVREHLNHGDPVLRKNNPKDILCQLVEKAISKKTKYIRIPILHYLSDTKSQKDLHSTLP